MKKDTERGNVVIEASIVLTIAVVMIAVLINLGFMTYQQNLLDTVAKEAAVDVANVYTGTFRDPMYGYIDASEFYKTELYRYIENFFASTQDDAAKRKAEWYSLYRLKKNQLMEFEDPDVDVQIVRKPGTLLQHQVVVTITAKFEMPLTAIFGGDHKATYVATGRADCLDLLDYFNTVGMANEALLGKVDDFLETFNKFVKIFDLSSLEG